LAKTHKNHTVNDDLEFLWLKNHFPVKGKRAAFSEAFGMVLLLALIIILGAILLPGLHYLDVSQDIFSLALKTWLSVLVFCAIATYCYYRIRLLLHRVARYYIHQGSLRFRKGYFRKSLNSFPLGQITDIYTRQIWYHIPFKLCDLVISTASAKSSSKGYVKSLPMKNANNMQVKLLELMEEVNSRTDHYIEDKFIEEESPKEDSLKNDENLPDRGKTFSPKSMAKSRTSAASRH